MTYIFTLLLLFFTTFQQALHCSSRVLLETSVNQEYLTLPLCIEGSLPDWLHGHFMRIGPALFNTDKQTVKHLFDGAGMVYKFDIQDKKISYTNRYLQTNYYKHAIATGEFISGFSGAPKPGVPAFDNANVNIIRVADHMIALTEVPVYVEFEKNNLNTIGHFSFDDALKGQVTTAHPVTDPKTCDLYNVMIRFGRTTFYDIYCIAQNNTSRKLICSIPVEKPSYMHSFAMTENYIILIESPFRVNPLDLMQQKKSFIENFTWQAHEKTVFTVIEKSSGAVVKKLEANPFFTFHQVNAFENNNTLIVDLVAFKDASVIFALQPHTQEPHHKSTLTRFKLDVQTNSVDETIITDYSFEMPKINDAYLTKKYNYCYGICYAQDESTPIIKLDIETGAVQTWHQHHCFASETTFVSCPNPKSEDDGVLLSIVLDAQEKKSFLLVLDAKDLSVKAKAYVPHHIPFSLHGTFISENK